MAGQKIKQANIFGRIGTGIGKGLAEQVPKEIERNRLASGLKELGEQKDLTPFQQFTGLVKHAHQYPQIVQSGTDLLRQEAYLNSIKNQYENGGGPQTGQKGYVPTQEELKAPLKGEVPTLATPEDTAQSYKTFIPPTEQQERQEAYENFNSNPARYDYNFDKALAERKSITARNQQIQQAHQTQEATAVGKEEKVKEALEKEMGKLKLNNIPPKARQAFEEKILNSMLPKSEGGKGLTQEQAIKTYSDELNAANRNYLDLSALSAWSPVEFDRRVNALQKSFEARNEQQLMMDQLIADYDLPPTYAAHKAYPLNKNQYPTLDKIPTQNPRSPLPDLTNKDYASLKKEMGKTGSPLSIAYEIEQKIRDPRAWLDYLNSHKDNLDVWQADQLNKNINLVDLKSTWLRAWEK